MVDILPSSHNKATGMDNSDNHHRMAPLPRNRVMEDIRHMEGVRILNR